MREYKSEVFPNMRVHGNGRYIDFVQGLYHTDKPEEFEMLKNFKYTELEAESPVVEANAPDAENIPAEVKDEVKEEAPEVEEAPEEVEPAKKFKTKFK